MTQVLGLFVAIGVAQALEVGEVRASLRAFDAYARYPLPALTDAQLEDLLAGKLVKLREVTAEGPQRVTGLWVVAPAKEQLFVSASDPHLSAVEEIHEVLVSSDGLTKRWVQLLDLPRPFADRHWVVDVTENIALHHATDGRAWEHWWTLASGGPELAERVVGEGKLQGVDPAMLASSVYLPSNTGAYLYVALPDGRTIFGFHATSTIGGMIPDNLVAQYTQATLGRALRTIVERVDEACAHYDAAHDPVPGGDGMPLPRNCGR